MKFLKFLLLTTFLTFMACTTFTSTPSTNVKELQFIGDVNISTRTFFNKTLLGGLSGIYFDEKSKRLVAISDDRGDRGEPRFYEFSVEVEGSDVKIRPLNVTPLKSSTGKRFKKGSIDFEGVTILKNGNLLISSEGDVRPTPRITPRLSEYTKKGKFVKYWSIPEKFLPESKGAQTKGVRENLGFESLTATKDGQFVFMANEEPLVQDGDIVTDKKNGLVRLIRYKNGKVEAEFPYKVDMIPNPDNFKTVRGNTGLVDMVALDSNNLLTLERAFVKNNYKNTIKIFKTSLSDGDEVSDTNDLSKKDVKQVKKTLLLDLDSILAKLNPQFQKLDNIEGICFGPTLSNGHKTLILVSDNNFSKHQRTLFIVFEIVP